MAKIEETIEPLPRFLTNQLVRDITCKYGSPAYVYSTKVAEEQADKALAFPNEYGLTVRYAMKSNPNKFMLRVFRDKGLKIDASSGFEAWRAMRANVRPEDILLTSQQIPDDLIDLINLGVKYNACSLNQLQNYGKLFPGTEVSIGVNPGLGSGGTNRTNTGGPASSFRIWHEQLPDAIKIVKKNKLKIKRLHTHIGSGSDPEVWKKVSQMSLGIAGRLVKEFNTDLEVLNLGGGYKVGRMCYEPSTDLQDCGKHIRESFREFYKSTGKKLELEIEPGTFLVANSGAVIGTVQEIKSTPLYKFIITDTGMTEVTRPSLYGAQHPITIVPKSRGGKKRGTEEYIVSGHCCESGDILTPARGDSEALQTRRLLEARRGDFVVIGGAGAYCAGMSTKNYNSYPEAPEIILHKRGDFSCSRMRQTLNQIVQNEL